MGVDPYIRGVTPVAWGGRQAPLPRPWAGPSGRPRRGRQAPPVARGGGRQALFFQGPRCKFKEKKLHLRPVALWGATDGYF